MVFKKVFDVLLLERVEKVGQLGAGDLNVLLLFLDSLLVQAQDGPTDMEEEDQSDCDQKVLLRRL